MLRILKSFFLLALGLAAVQRASSFSVFGPAESWQTPTLDYVTRYYYGNDNELGGPKQLAAGSRMNTAIVTYGFDYSFLQFFGTEGVNAVTKAIQEYNALPPASSARLNSYLMQGNQLINYSAQALSLTDLKSTTMAIMIEHMGLIGETHVWDLRTRNPLPTPTPCRFEYTVINRNYDPVSYNPSAYVNGVQYYYTIWDGCSNGVSVADAIENAVDETQPAQYVYTAVSTRYGLQTGGFYLGLTYDDVGGIKYLYNPNRFELEGLETNDFITPGGFSTYLPVNVAETNAGPGGGSGLLLGGVNKIQYVRLNYNSLLGTGFTPRQFSYSIPMITNGTLRSIRVTRTVFQPDVIFTAGDLVSNTTAYPLLYSSYSRGFNYITNGYIGLGENEVTAQVIAPEEIITFNTITPAYINASPSFLDESQYVDYPVLQWGSFDGSTNAPILFPNGSSLKALEAEVLHGVGQTSLNNGVYNPLTVATNTTTDTGTGATGGATQ